MSKPFSFRPLIDRLAVGVHVLYAKLHGTAVRDGVGQVSRQPGDDCFNRTEADVADLRENLPLEVGTRINHVLGRNPKQLIFRLFNLIGNALLALGRGEEDKVNHLGVESPRRSEVNLDVPSRDGVAVGVVHREADLGDARPTVVLRDSTPRVTERIDTIPFLLGDAHASAHLLYSVVRIRTKRVGVAERTTVRDSRYSLKK